MTDLTPAKIQAMFDQPPTPTEEHAAQVRVEIATLDAADLRPMLVLQRLEIERLRAERERAHNAGPLSDQLGLLAGEETMDKWDRMAAADAAEREEAASYELRAEVERLLRWKGTNAPRLEALEGLLRSAQHEAAQGTEALASLASERAANAILTDEIERLRAELAAECERCARMRDALSLIAAPARSDGSWNRDREACRLLAEQALRHGEAHD